MPFTVQKLQAFISQLSNAVERRDVAVTPIFVAPADGPMAPPPNSDGSSWQRLEVGQLYGVEHGTVWLRAYLRIPEAMQGQQVVMQLYWDTTAQDWGLLRLEATTFLDGMAIGGFDWRHQVLVLPEQANDGRTHTFTLQTYTSVPVPFGGLALLQRNQHIWHLFHLMQTSLNIVLALDKHDIASHTMLHHLNTAYSLLDLREGYHSERFVASVQEALDYLQAHLTVGLNTGNRPHVVVSGHAHLDVAWLWPYWRTRQKIAHTVSNVLALMDRYPYYHYSQSQPQLLQWLKEDLPEVFARVKERVAEGRFEPVGAMWVEADCNLTSGESLVRQILHGTHFTRQEFGITPSLIWLPDVFGYSAALPQIMRGCNISTFMTTKISWNQFNRMPCDTFRWRGIDGSEVLTHFITAPDAQPANVTYYTYNGPLQPSGILGTWTNYHQQAINDELLYLCGWGDGGGGPTEKQLERIPVMADMPDFPTVQMGRVTDYFDALYERVWDNPRLPTWVGELYLEYHRGTYTSQAHVKQANRRAELLYRDAELLNAWAGLYGMPSRQAELNEGWRHILLNQFHDVLPGSSIAEVYADVRRIYAEIRAIGEQQRNASIAVLCKRLGQVGNMPVLLNTLPWERTDPILLPVSASIPGEGTQQVTNWDGEPSLLLDGVHVPSCGATFLQTDTVHPSIAEHQACSAVYTETGIVLSNDYYELTLDTQGEIDRLYDKRAARDVLVVGQTGNQIVAFEDRPMKFDAWDIDIYYEEKPYPVREAATARVIEEGPLRATVEVVRTFLSSRITQRISLWRNSPRIDFATEVDWHEHQMLLKAVFPVAINNARATYEIQFGSVERPTHRNTSWDLARFEVCAHRWVDLSEGGYGVSLLNDSKYGHDIHDTAMRLTLLKSGVYPDPNADQGLHRFTYSLLPHQGDWREAQTVRRAYELNVPVLSVMSDSDVLETSVSKPAAISFIRTDCEHIVVETVKPAEDGDGLIVRLYEAHNQRGQGKLFFATNIVSARECNLLEESTGDASYQENILTFSVRPFEIKTFRVHLARA
ncbi:MAG TPA: alpha-mannosidase [Ktedonobacteraceae bacterium]|nr:alpha-mannosidase [Ktedonobacteraceae bacterium]